MPHTLFSGAELDALYPPLTAPADELSDDSLADENDCVFKHGQKLAEEIRQQTKDQGRKKRPDALEHNNGAATTPPDRAMAGRHLGGGVLVGALLHPITATTTNLYSDDFDHFPGDKFIDNSADMSPMSPTRLRPVLYTLDTLDAGSSVSLSLFV